MVGSPSLTHFGSAHAVDFSRTHPNALGVLIELNTIEGRCLGFLLDPEHAERLTDTVDELLAEILRRRIGLSTNAAMWHEPVMVEPDEEVVPFNDPAWDDATRWTLTDSDD